MKKTLWTILLLWVSSAVKGLQVKQGGTMELARLKMSLMYVRSIKTFRLLFMSLLSMGICLVFLLVSLILFHISLFLYAPWGMATKMIVGLLCSLAYLLASAAICSQIFSPDNWLKIFHAEGIIKQLNGKAGASHDEYEENNPLNQNYDQPDRSTSKRY